MVSFKHSTRDKLLYCHVLWPDADYHHLGHPGLSLSMNLTLVFHREVDHAGNKVPHEDRSIGMSGHTLVRVIISRSVRLQDLAI